ncbi:MAG: hypothetical protein ACRC6F_02005, partial [Aeromonas sp.]
MGLLAVISVTIVGIIFGVEKLRETSHTEVNKTRAVTNRVVTRHRREAAGTLGRDCIKQYGGFELDYVNGSSTSFTFDLCAVIPCSGYPTAWVGYDVYLCKVRYPSLEQWCPTWGSVWIGTNKNLAKSIDKNADYFTIQRDHRSKAYHNPITLSISKLTHNPNMYTNRGIDEPCWPRGAPYFYVTLGVELTGKDAMGLIKINILNPEETKNITPVAVASAVPGVIGVDYTKLKPEDIIEKATGYGETNLWLDWLINTAKEQKLDDCIACAGA